MGKIYEGENKLNILQVCDKLRNEITAEQATALSRWYDPEFKGTAKAQFAHMVLDTYKDMPNTTEHDMMIKKLAKHLMEKYMKSTSTMEGEDSAFRLLIDDIVNKSNK
jgi:hypothetical protein